MESFCSDLDLTIALGEFNFEDAIYSRFNNSEQYISRAVSLVILVIMIFTVTITLVNLFIAVIISDRRDLKIFVLFTWQRTSS